MNLSRIAELEAENDLLRRENARLRAQLFGSLPSPRDAVGAAEFPSIEVCLPIEGDSGGR